MKVHAAKRPEDATIDALRKCLWWLDECRKLGWGDDSMKNLEGIFWAYHDNEGNKHGHKPD